MAKNKLASALSIATLVVGSGIFTPAVWAENSSTILNDCNGIESCAIVKSTSELSGALNAKTSTIIVGESFDLTDDLRPGEAFSLYLNDNTITSDGWSFITTKDVNIYGGENGKIKEIGGVYAPFYVHGGVFTLNSGNIETVGNARGIQADSDNTSVVINGGTISTRVNAIELDDYAKATINGGKVNSAYYAVALFDHTQLVLNDGEIESTADDGVAIGGNGSLGGDNVGIEANVVINGGTIRSGELGIYAPQADGVTEINGGTIEAKTGVEVRAGTLNIKGGNFIVSEGAEYEVVANGSGSTTVGAAVAVAQHTTKKPITVNISGGTFIAPVVFSEANPQGNSEEDISKVKLAITGGVFSGSVISEDFEREDFVTGGDFVDTTASEDGSSKVEIEGAVVSESLKSLSVAEAETDGLTLADGSEAAEVKFARDIKLVDEENNTIEVAKEDGVNLTIHLDVSDEEYADLSQYDKVVAIYFDDQGVEQERIDATLQAKGEGGYEVMFTTTHLSTYAIAGVNETSSESEAASESSDSAAPETGTVTREGASAMNAAVVTSIAVGLLVSIMGFAVLIRRK